MRIKLFILGLFLIILGLGFVSAIFDLKVEKISKGNVIISELDNPAVFDLIITNNMDSDTAEIYTLVGVSMTPKGTFEIPKGKTTIEVFALPDKDFRRNEGLYSFEYQIKGQKQGIFKDKLNIRVVKLKDAFELGNLEIHPDDKEVKIKIKNTVDANLMNVNARFKSSFFDVERKLDFDPFQEVEIPIEIGLNNFSKLAAGEYDLNAEIKVEDAGVEFKSKINYVEKEDSSVLKKSSGFLIRKTILTNMNQGNTFIKGKVSMKKDIFSRLFTSYSDAPTKSERGGLVVEYIWERDLKPGESFSIVSSTNYTFPFILVILVAVIAFLVRIYTLTALNVHKSVSYVKTKGGEFALKVKIRIRARKHIRNVQITDRLPAMTKLYERFGHEPDKIDKETRHLIWNLNNLNSGEERVFTYIIYSNLRTVGRFELPAVRVIFEREGEKKEVTSNKAYFVSESVAE